MHDRVLENAFTDEKIEIDRIVMEQRRRIDGCTHSARTENAIASVCVDCGDSEPGWLVRRVQVLEDEVTQLRESVRPENR